MRYERSGCIKEANELFKFKIYISRRSFSKGKSYTFSWSWISYFNIKRNLIQTSGQKNTFVYNFLKLFNFLHYFCCFPEKLLVKNTTPISHKKLYMKMLLFFKCIWISADHITLKPSFTRCMFNSLLKIFMQ